MILWVSAYHYNKVQAISDGPKNKKDMTHIGSLVLNNVLEINRWLNNRHD